MRREYDFSKAVRGKFYRPGAKLLIPVYLEPKVQAAVAERAALDGVAVSEMVNRVLERELAPAKEAKPSARGRAARKAQLVLIGSGAFTTSERARGKDEGVKRDAARGSASGKFSAPSGHRTNPVPHRKLRQPTAVAKKAAKRLKR